MQILGENKLEIYINEEDRKLYVRKRYIEEYLSPK